MSFSYARDLIDQFKVVLAFFYGLLSPRLA